MVNIRDLLGKLKADHSADDIKWVIDPVEGIDFLLSPDAEANPIDFAIKNPLFGMQLAYLKGLHEQDYAEKTPDGYTIQSDYVADLDDDFFELFGLPAPFTGSYKARIESSTANVNFSVDIDLLMPDGNLITHYSLHGPFLRLAEKEFYRLTPTEWRALKTARDHSLLSPENRGEYENNWFMFQLELAKKSGMEIDLGHFNNLDLIQPETIGVAVEELQNGDLALTPTFGPGMKLKDIKARLGQVDTSDDCVLRVNNRMVLLDQARVEATHEILTNRNIPKDEIQTFLKSPTAYLNSSLIDLDTGFSLRVHGTEKFVHRYFGDVEKSNINWFEEVGKLLEPTSAISQLVTSEETLKEVVNAIENANKNGAEVLEYNDKTFDISDEVNVQETVKNIKEKLANPPKDKTTDEISPPEGKVVLAIDSNDEDLSFTNKFSITDSDFSLQSFNQNNLKRSPYPHQDQGISWLLSHLVLSERTEGGSGALLADDMGLGKTYMVLVAIAEWFQRNELKGTTNKPVMIVAPLGLLENWQAEVEETFKGSPFTDIVTLQSNSDLSRFKVKGASREINQNVQSGNQNPDTTKIRYSLKVGGAFKSERLDIPGRLVLTTYETLRDYQFSLCRVDWGVIAFDEAQNLKNPNALATIAAKALKADMKLLATGTPVENSLKDFWCLMDTATPGLLGSWQSFRTEFITPITSAKEGEAYNIKLDIGRKLRSKVSKFMLRRTKAEELDGLPEKHIYSGDDQQNNHKFLTTLAGKMTGEQLSNYDQIVSAVNNSGPAKQSLLLPSLHRLKVTSIHHDIINNVTLPSNAKDLLKQSEASSKIKSMLTILKNIQKREEKVLIFATTKAVQAYVSVLVSTHFKIPVEIINGETKAIATKTETLTRKGIIDTFQSKLGFGVIVMSPVAAGVGLTVVGANNVIHLERHWNPAKEAQATDRVYRIGQEKAVNVYLPMALHPSLRSFDLHLNSLLAQKVDLSDAVVAPEQVEAAHMGGVF